MRKALTSFLLLCALVIVCLHTIRGQGIPPQAGTPLQGPPTISVAQIDQVLALAHSPAQGLGHDLYTLGVQYAIDPAIALAFFHHESTYGRYGVANVTHNLGNIRCSSGYSCIEGYRAYPSWTAGAHDWYQLMQQVYLPRKLTTIETIIPVYAPAADHNNEQTYIASIRNDLARWQKGQV